MKQAEEEATRLRAMEVSAVTEKEEKEKQEQQKTDYVGAQGNDEIEEIRKKNLEAQIAKHAQINASDAAVAANIAARKKAREEAAQAAQECSAISVPMSAAKRFPKSVTSRSTVPVRKQYCPLPSVLS